MGNSSPTTSNSFPYIPLTDKSHFQGFPSSLWSKVFPTVYLVENLASSDLVTFTNIKNPDQIFLLVHSDNFHLVKGRIMGWIDLVSSVNISKDTISIMFWNVLNFVSCGVRSQKKVFCQIICVTFASGNMIWLDQETIKIFICVYWWLSFFFFQKMFIKQLKIKI